MIPYPDLDPIAFRIGPLAVRWYGIAYILGFAAAYGLLRRQVSGGRLPLSREGVGDLLTWLVGGVVLGGRLGYVLFYNFTFFLSNPLKIVAVWEGGMSFHGGLLGVAVAAVLFCRKRGLSLVELGDSLALAVPPGLCFGRLANFVNGELYGRVSEVPWAMVFPGGGALPRHPSQLYEALLEGPLLWGFVFLASRGPERRHGAGVAAFLGGYGALRFLVEYTREPDAHLGLVVGTFTMGQVLSAVMVAAGIGFWLAGGRSAGTTREQQ